MKDDIRNELTKRVDSMLKYPSEYYKSYILNEVYKEAMAIRLPGLTIGEVKINSEMEVIEVRMYKDILNRFKENDISEILTNEFRGFKIK